MASPGLKATVQLRSEGERHDLFDEATKRTLALSAIEARLLGLWDGLCSATHLTDVARAHGVVIEARQASVFLERLGRAGFLASTPTTDSGLVPDAPGLERLEDRVPKLRGDLLIAKAPGTKGVLQVTDPLKGRSFTLYDFEVSIARLLDGRRTAGQLLDAAGRLGIPVNLDSLRKFVRQLRGYRFIDELAAVPHAADDAAPAPESWTPELRELYETALRFWRQDKLDHAIEYLTALLEVSPQLEEPRELKARLESLRAGEVEVEVNFDSLHGVANPLLAPPADAPKVDFMALHSQPPDVGMASPPAAVPLDFTALLAPKPASSPPSASVPPTQKPSAPRASTPTAAPPPVDVAAPPGQKPSAPRAPTPTAAAAPLEALAPPGQKPSAPRPSTPATPAAAPPLDFLAMHSQKPAAASPLEALPPPVQKPSAPRLPTPTGAPAAPVDFLAMHSQKPLAFPPSAPAPVAAPPTPAPAPVTDSMVVESTPAAAVPYSTPSQMLNHGEDPFRLYEPGIVVPPAQPEGPPVASMPSLIIDEDLGATTTAPQDAGSSSSVLSMFSGYAAEAGPPTAAAPRPEAAESPKEARADAPVATSDAPETVATRSSLLAWRPSRRVLMAGGVGLLVILLGTAGWLLRSVPRHASLPCRLEALETVTVVAPWTGALAPPAAADGATVKASQPLGAMDEAPVKQRLAAITRRQDELARERTTLRPGSEKAVKQARAKVEAARRANADADAKLARADALPPAQRKAALVKQKKAAAAVKLKLRKAEAALEALTHAVALARITDELQALEAESSRLLEQQSNSALVAPVAGRVTWLVKPGEAVQLGAPVARVDPGRWRVRADAHLTLPPGIPVEATLTVGEVSLEVRRLEVQADTVQGLVEASTPLPATGTLEIAAGERHAYELLFGDD